MGTIRRFTTITALLTLFAVLIALPSRTLAGALGPSGIRLSLSAHCFSVRPRPTYLEVSLGYVVPGSAYRFVLQPTFAAFGGGSMGSHGAGANEVVHFPYQIPNRPDDVGHWTVSAYRRGKLVARNTFTIVRESCSQPSPMPAGSGPAPRQIVTRYFADLAARRYRAAYLLEAPCGISYSVPNEGGPPGSASFAGRGPAGPGNKVSAYGILRSVRVTGISRFHQPLLDRNHIRAFLVRGWYTFDYTRVPWANNKHSNGFHVVKIGLWQCAGRWGVEPGYWLIAGGGELNWR